MYSSELHPFPGFNLLLLTDVRPSCRNIQRFILSQGKPIFHTHQFAAILMRFIYRFSAASAWNARPHRHGMRHQMVCKPGSVRPPVLAHGRGDGHSSGTHIAARLARPTRVSVRRPTKAAPKARPRTPIWSCSRWGLPCRSRRRARGGLLPHPFTLAARLRRRGGLLSVALSLGSPPPGVTRHRVSVEPGLSSPPRVSPLRRSGHPTI